jgi:hypothetical protein
MEKLHEPMRVKVTRSGKKVTHAEDVVDFVLMHSLVSDSTTPARFDAVTRRWRRATALDFELLLRVLQKESDNNTDPDPAAAAAWNEKEARTWLSRHLVVTKGWFDSTMDRVTQRFAMKMRISTIVFAFVLVFTFHINTFDILRQLRDDPVAVARLNAQLESHINDLDPAAQSDEALKRRTDAIRSLQSELQASQISIYAENWYDRLPARLILELEFGTFQGDSRAFVGILMTAALLSLGAPFWFNQLKNISTLRTVAAQKTGDSTTSHSVPPVATFSFTQRKA